MRKRLAYRVAYARYPKVRDALAARPAAYNRLLDELDELAEAKVAYVFCPDTMPIDYMTADRRRLMGAYNDGMAQCRGELPCWRAWLKG